MTAKRLLVTGGSGFIGSNFLRFLLRARKDVAAVNLDKLTYAGNPANTRDFETDPRYRFVQGDICDFKVVNGLMREADAVVHFAAETHVDRSISSAEQFVRTNVLGTHVLLESARQNKMKRFLHFSTDEVYGSCKVGSFKETDPLNPSSPYSASKAASDLLALSYFKTHGLDVVILRCSNNFGPYQFPEKVIPLFITNLIEGKKVPLYAKGENMRDWIYVEECARAIDCVLENGIAGEIYNVGAGSEITNIELTRRLLNAFGHGEEAIEYVADRPAHDFRYSLDVHKLKGLGYAPNCSFEASLRKTIDWYKANRGWWEPLKRDSFTLK